MKKLIALISPVGKSKEQLVEETYEAMQKYFRVEKEVLNPDNLIEDLTDSEEGNAFQVTGIPNSKSLEELMAEYRKSGEEQETTPQGQKEAFVSLHFNKKDDKK